MKRLRPLYFFLKRYVYLTSFLYYRRINIHNVSNVPKNGPVIFVPNHQNAFMDAIVIAVTSPRKPWFLTRASIFGNTVARYWLSSLRMIPIYRIRDGLQNMRKNDETIEICVNLLKNNETILIFAEGNHNRQWSLRPLQKGLARISFAFESPDNFASGLKIVPVGLQYEKHKQFRSDLLINYGKPINVADFRDVYQSDPLKATTQLIEKVKNELSSLIIDIQDIENHDVIKSAIINRPNREKNLVKRLQADQEFLRKGDFSRTADSRVKPKLLLKILGFPIFLYGAMNHIVIYLLIRYILKHFIKDDHWTSSIKFAGMIIISPIMYLLQAILLWQFFPHWACMAAYIISLPITAVLAGDYRVNVLKNSH